MNEQEDNTIRFSLRQMLGVTAYIALTLGVVTYTGSIVLGIHLSMCLIAWMMWRLFRGFPAGLIPVLLGADFMFLIAYYWVVCGIEDDSLVVRPILSAFASVLFLLGIVMIVRADDKRQRFWRHQMVIAATVSCVLVALWSAVIISGNSAITQRRASDVAATNQARAKAIAMVEEVRQRIGTTPDEDTLAELLREPLPSVRWNGRTLQILYQRTGDTTYQLEYWDMSAFLGDSIVYDSATPKKGWYRIPF